MTVQWARRSVYEWDFDSNDDGGRMMGLNEDGDFALFGVNTEDPSSAGSSSDEEGGFNSKASPGMYALLGMDSTSTSSSPTNAVVAPPGDLLTGSSDDKSQQRASSEGRTESRHPAVEHEIDPEEVSWLENWLLDVIPTLKPNDSRNYATNLAKIGFDPECITKSELEMDDLYFMKVLHRRFLFNKISSLSRQFVAVAVEAKLQNVQY